MAHSSTHVEDQIPLAILARDAGIGRRTLERWHARYKAGGFAGLTDACRSDAGERRFPDELVHLIEGLALTRPRPAIATLHRTIATRCASKGWHVPSYATVRLIVTGLDAGMVTLALEGPPPYRDKFEMIFRRQSARPNEIWQADHTMLDILVIGTDGRAVRPWLTTVLDDCSRAICGYFVFIGAPSAMNTALALRQAIWHKSDPSWPMCGIPDVLYVDHGSDFTSHQLEQTAIDLHLRIIHSAARPQGRGKIERFFGTINTELLATLPGHIVPDRAWPAPQLSLSDLDDALSAFITTYNERPHSEIGVSPKVAWTADGWMPRFPDSLEALDGFLLTVTRTRLVGRDGIHFQGLRYLSPPLAPYVGIAVTIRYDPRDITEIRVYDRDTFVCTAVDPDHQSLTVSLKDIQAARNAQRRALRTEINERIATVKSHDPAPVRPATAPHPAQPSRPRLRSYEEDEP